MKKRILALLMCVSILCSILPSSAFATDTEPAATETQAITPECTCGQEEHTSACPLYEAPTCTCEAAEGAAHTQECPLYEAPVEALATTDNCPYCEETTAGDGTVTHAANCNAAYIYDGTADVGKYVQVINDEYAISVCEDGAVSEDDSAVFYYEEFTEGTIMRIEGWYWRSETASIWYQVSFYSGGMVEESLEYWPETAWILYDYSDPNYEYDPGLAFLSTCDTCGKPDCSEEHNAAAIPVYCTVCEAYDCGLTHLYCRACGVADCTKAHIWCGICGDYDCGITHETYTPIAAPVIPENPTLTEGEVVSIVDEYGDPVTADEGFLLAEGTKASLSAWSDLENASYQWQICYDVENDLWADIHGHNEKGILVSSAMVKSIITDAQTCAPIRCVVTSSETMETSAAIPVTIMEQTSVFSTSAGEALLAGTENSESSEQSDEDVTIYTVTIEYKYSSESQFNGQLVSQAYIAEFPAGSTPDSNPVISPNCIGYAPNFAQIDLSILGELTENKTITVYYSPAEVSYTVRHYQQNIDDDEYTWVDTTLATGLTEQLTSDAAKNNNPEKDYEGFTALPHYAEKMAADSSTTIDIYYDRNYYLMSFDLDGGYGVEAVYARYGAAVSVGTPEKAGYAFTGWTYNGTADSIPTTMPAENRSYTALWSPGNTTYTIAYWLENPDTSDVYDFVGSVAASANSGSVVSGNADAVDNGIFTADEVKYYSFNADKTDASVTVAGDGSTVVNVYYDRNEYVLRFYYARSYVIDGKTIYQISHSNSYYDTVGEDVSAASWNDTSNNIKPALSSDYEEKTGTVGNNTNNTYYYFDLTVKYGQDISDIWPHTPITNATDSTTFGKSFVSWGTQPGSGYFEANSNKNIKGPYSTVTSDLLVSASVVAPTVNHNLVAYYGSPTMWTVYVYYSALKNETETKDYDGQQYVLQGEPINYGAQIGSVADLANLEFPGVEFVGRVDKKNNDDETDDYSTQWYYKRIEHTLTLDNNYGSTIEFTIPYGGKLSDYITSVSSPQYPTDLPAGAYEFGGWYQSKDGIGALDTSITMPNEDLIYYAKWDPKVYTVTVNDGNGTVLSTRQVNYGSRATKPTDPTMDDATFIGWYYLDAQGEEQRFDFDNMTITHDMTIYAKWRSNIMKQVTIRYILQNEDGTETPVADSEVLMLRVGATRTFEAKTGNSLYETYRTGTFPTTATTSITPTSDDEEFLVTFYYKQYKAVAYKVEFYVQLGVDKDNDGAKDLRAAFWTVDGEVEFIEYDDNIPDGATVYVEYNEAHPDNDKAIVTELYTPEVMSNAGWSLPDNYVPNALRIQRVIVPGENNAYNPDNTIIFIYTYDPDAALYSVNHHIQASDGSDTYELYSHKEYAGNIDQTVTDGPISIPGHTYSSDVTDSLKQSGTILSDDGSTMTGTVNAQDSLELNFYYTVNQYPYQIMYLEKDTNRVLMDTKTTDENGKPLMANYGSQVTYTLGTNAENALLEDYEVDAESKDIYIQMEAGNAASINTIIFYYTRKSADLLVSKTVALDAEQAQQTGISELPPDALTQDFTYTITYPMGFYKSVYDCIITDVDGNVTYGTVVAQTTTMTFTLKHGQTIQIKDLDMGAYTITETYVPGFRITVNGNTAAQQREDVSITAELVSANQNVEVKFLNSYPFFTGELVLGKTITKADTSDPDATGTYKVTVTLNPYDDTREKDRIITWTEDGVAKSFTVPALTDTYTTKSFTFDVLVPVGRTVTLSGVPAGDFTAEETVKGTVGYIADYYEVKSYSKLHNNEETVEGSGPEVTGVIHGGHPTTVTFGNTYKKGDLTINKTVTEEYSGNWTADHADGDTFTFSVTGTTELPAGTYNATIGTETISVNVGTDGKVSMDDAQIAVSADTKAGSLTIENLPAGYYTVTETEDEAYTITTQPASNLLINTTETATQANFVNEYKRTTGNLKISKTIVLVDEQASIDTNKEFTFTVELLNEQLSGSYTCGIKGTNGTADESDDTVVSGSAVSVAPDSNGIITVVLKHNEYVVIEGLPVGNYTVTEAHHEGYNSNFTERPDSLDTYSPVTIKTGETATASCVNQFPVYYGDLKIQKVVTNAHSLSKAPDTDVFVFTISGGKLVNGNTYSYTTYSNADDTTGTAGTAAVTDGDLTVELLGGQHIVIRALPVGIYTVTETMKDSTLADHYRTSWTFNNGTSSGTTATASNIPVSKASDNTDSIVFTNEYKNHLASLTITKSGAQNIDENQSFIFEVAGPDGYKQTVVIRGNCSVTIKDLPAGAYTVTENTDWSWRYETQSVTPDGGNVTLIPMGTGTVNFVNKREKNYWLGGDNWVVNTFDTINNIISKIEGEDVSSGGTSD